MQGRARCRGSKDAEALDSCRAREAHARGHETPMASRSFQEGPIRTGDIHRQSRAEDRRGQAAEPVRDIHRRHAGLDGAAGDGGPDQL